MKLYDLEHIKINKLQKMTAYMINKKDTTIQNLMDLYSKGLQEKALKEAVGVAIINPNSAEILNIIASVTFKLGQRTSSLKFYNRALKIQPNLAEAYNNKGFVSSSLDDFSNVLKNCFSIIP